MAESAAQGPPTNPEVGEAPGQQGEPDGELPGTPGKAGDWQVTEVSETTAGCKGDAAGPEVSHSTTGLEVPEAARSKELGKTEPERIASVAAEQGGEKAGGEAAAETSDVAKPTPACEHAPVMRPYCQHPKRAWPVACGVHLMLLMTFGILNATVGRAFLNQSTKVALHLWENKWRMRMDSVAEGDKICTWDVGSQSAQPQQETPRVPAGFKEYKLEVVYNALDGNMLTVEKLNKVKELEDYIAQHPDYPKFCLRQPQTSLTGLAACKSPLSSVMACNPSLCGMMQNQAGDPGPQAGCGPANAQGLTPASDCSPVKSIPAGVYNCMTPGGCSRREWVLNETFLTSKVEAYSRATFAQDMPETNILSTMDSSFGAGSSTSSALRAVFQFGFPLEGYENTADRSEDQVQKVEDFLSDAYFERLNTYNDAEEDSLFLIGYSGGPLRDMSIQRLLMGDFSKVAAAFIVVFLYVLFMTSSFFFSALALAQIFLCFASGFIVYRILFGNFFGSFHIMAIFLLLGVGVDDVFVFNDHFAAALQVDKKYQHDFWGRMTWTWKHAVQAMGVTSATTATSFFMNVVSSFPGIAAFGVFAGSLVLVMYMSMVFFWPAVVAFHYVHFKDRPFLCGIPAKIEKCLANSSPEAQQEVEEEENDMKKPAIVRFFENHFSYFILRHRVKIILAFTVVSVYMIVQVTRIQPEKSQPQFLPDTHPVAQFQSLMRDKFVRGGSVTNTKVNLIIGMDKEPIDREGTDPTGEGYGEGSSKVGTLGRVAWNPHFTTSDGATNFSVILGGLDCMVQLCDAMEVRSSERNTGGLPAFAVKGCFSRDAKRFLMRTQPTTWESTWANITSGNFLAMQSTMQQLVATDSQLMQEIEAYTYAEKVGEQILWRFLRVELKLTSDKNMAHSDGIALGERWESWLSDQMATGSCATTASTFWGFVYAQDFHQFAVTETLLSEMFTGIIVSISVALVVLVLATGNIIEGSIAAFSIGMIVIWVIAMIPTLGWELGMVENIVMVMVPGLSVDFTSHLAEAYNQAKYDEREHRVVHALEHSGVSIVSGSISTSMAAMCLIFCRIVFFRKFGALILCTIFFAVLFSLFFFPSVMALIGPVGTQGDWHKFIHPKLQRDIGGEKKLRVKYTRTLSDIIVEEPENTGEEQEQNKRAAPSQQQ